MRPAVHVLPPCQPPAQAEMVKMELGRDWEGGVAPAHMLRLLIEKHAPCDVAWKRKCENSSESNAAEWKSRSVQIFTFADGSQCAADFFARGGKAMGRVRVSFC